MVWVLLYLLVVFTVCLWFSLFVSLVGWLFILMFLFVCFLFVWWFGRLFGAYVYGFH